MDPMSSDEEGEIIPDQVTNFCFVDRKNAPASICVLPLQGKDIEKSEGFTSELFLHGDADNGLQKIYKKAFAWRFELCYVHPEIYVLIKDNKWIKLYKPRKSYEAFIRTLMVAVHFLHFVKKNPTEPREVVWSHMPKILSTFEVVPSENDLFAHTPIIAEAARRDKDIAKSKCVAKLLSNMHGDKAIPDEAQEKCVVKRPDFVVDDGGDEDVEGDCDGDSESDDEAWQLFDPVCAYCDDGGQILCCEGRCKRSFHPSIESGAESFCESLGYKHEQPDVFLCKNCQYQQHQCFACGLLGSSDQSSGAEVFPCISATCGHFYHPGCVSKLLCPSNETQAVELKKKIAEGESFTCPLHICCVCKQIEDKTVHALQFGLCRRCPKAYHRKCLPRTIAFQSDPENNPHLRAWEGLLQNRILIYCMDHKIISKIATPRRDHLLFPEGNIEKNQPYSGPLPGKVKNDLVTKSKKCGSYEEIAAVKDKKPLHGTQGTSRFGDSVERAVKRLPEVSVEKLRAMTSKDYQMPIRGKMCKFSTGGKGYSSEINQQSQSQQPLKLSSKMQHKLDSKPTSIPKVKMEQRPPVNKGCLIPSPERAKMEQRIADLMKSSSALIDREKFIEEKRRTCINPYSQNIKEKIMTMEMVEHAVKAIRVAQKKLGNGGTIEEAKKICPPEVLNQIFKWKTKLRVYLGPFLHGARYTSFGRHFTKVDKLKEVVERLKWYAQDGDTIVDFCCGSNDFSCLMKEALDKLGKNCSFRNFDLMRPKNDFNFEKKDWMTVQSEELPAGSNLIMGLNPPFGVHAALANKFINKALTFKPKILILIVPRETERLDNKKFPYDLIWENDTMLSGMSFYLPGSVNVHNQQLEQWNIDTPPLYLWSRRDWTDKHRSIAQNLGHIQRDRGCREFPSFGVQPPDSNYLMEDNQDNDWTGKHGAIAQNLGHIQRDRGFREFPSVGVQPADSNYLMEDNQDCFGDFSSIMSVCPDISSLLDDIPDASVDPDHNTMFRGQFQAPLECNQNNLLHQSRGQSYLPAPLECNQNNTLHQSRGQSYFQAPLECNQNNILYQSRGNLDMQWQSNRNDIFRQSHGQSYINLEMQLQSNWNDVHQQSLGTSNKKFEMMHQEVEDMDTSSS